MAATKTFYYETSSIISIKEEKGMTIKTQETKIDKNGKKEFYKRISKLENDTEIIITEEGNKNLKYLFPENNLSN